MEKREETKNFFELEWFRVRTEKSKNEPCSSHATIKISVDGKETIDAAEGTGPVSAIDNALRKVLSGIYKTDLDAMCLVDYNVHVINGGKGSASKVRVSIESQDEYRRWTTIGTSEDIIEASWQALADSFRYKLAKNGKK
ncbi:hypothetical protein KAU09_03290 [Candidatus Parcubacteria bacterium]|nr:hypothetical protein [Candidatus Parcubacteria bacterium]